MSSRISQPKRGRGGSGGLRGKARRAAQQERRAASTTSLTRNILERQISRASHRQFKQAAKGAKFSNFGLKTTFDIHDPDASKLKLSFLRKRSKIVEIVTSADLIFGLTHSGVCAAFDRSTKKRICFLNVTPDEVIRSLFYNKSNDSLITVSVYKADDFSSLRCRTTPTQYIRRGRPEDGFELFETESLNWPGFVEFDEVNSKVLTYSAKERVYKVWDLANYSLLFSFADKNIDEVKVSPGILLVIYNRERTASHVLLKILSIEDGRELKAFQHLLHRTKPFDFIEMFNDRLLLKQAHESLQILDVKHSSVAEVKKEEFKTPSAFIFLYENSKFLTFRGRDVAVWNQNGELVTKFDDHQLTEFTSNTNNIYITSQQDLIISYCLNEDQTKSVNVSEISTGRCVAKLTDKDVDMEDVDMIDCSKPLDNVTALYYNEDTNEIVTGTQTGRIHVWTN